MTALLKYTAPDQLDEMWQIAEPMLRRVERQIGSRMGVDNIHARLKSGAETLWFIYVNDDIVATMTTSVKFYARQTRMMIENVAGCQMDEWGADVIAELKRVCVAGGLNGIEAHGRLGWKKYHAAHGFRVRDVIYEMEF
jgi:hypothetical protein